MNKLKTAINDKPSLADFINVVKDAWANPVSFAQQKQAGIDGPKRLDCLNEIRQYIDDNSNMKILNIVLSTERVIMNT